MDEPSRIALDGGGLLFNGSLLAIIGGAIGGAVWRTGNFLAPLITRWVEAQIAFVNGLKESSESQAASLQSIEHTQADSFSLIAQSQRDLHETSQRNHEKTLDILQTVANAMAQTAASNKENAGTLQAVATNQEVLLRVIGEKPNGHVD